MWKLNKVYLIMQQKKDLQKSSTVDISEYVKRLILLF